MSLTGINSAETILGSHEWQLDKLENYAITIWKKPTFTMDLELQNAKYAFTLFTMTHWRGEKSELETKEQQIQGTKTMFNQFEKCQCIVCV